MTLEEHLILRQEVDDQIRRRVELLRRSIEDPQPTWQIETERPLLPAGPSEPADPRATHHENTPIGPRITLPSVCPPALIPPEEEES